jgi:hypothetical protein
MGIPLKKTGFQKKNGTRPHFKKRQNRKLNQTRDKVTKVDDVPRRV